MATVDYNFQMNSEQTTTTTTGSIIGYIIMAILLWRIFSKAGRPGWLALIPIVNIFVLIQVSGHSGLWVLLIWIPIVGWIISIVFSVHLARNFGKGGVFGFFLLWLVSIIGYLILAFGSSTYQDPRTVVRA
ncbi:DUF5684 domain-containing protein [Glaciihabitans sp. UYNi722]|uniref:DUF5684 domain-containing protein n=1 Tax=Glaciihabitans sp. UYNi722 TaxID=3156344 RepID=UPI00339B95A8